MLPFDLPRHPTKTVDIQVVSREPGVAPTQWVGCGPDVDRVAIPSPSSGEAGVEVGVCLGNAAHGDLRTDESIQLAGELVGLVQVGFK